MINSLKNYEKKKGTHEEGEIADLQQKTGKCWIEKPWGGSVKTSAFLILMTGAEDPP
jgi:hypothetical protein